MADTLWKIDAVLDNDELEVFETAFDSVAESTTIQEIEKGENKGKWLFSAFSESKPDMTQLKASFEVLSFINNMPVPKYTIEEIENKNWLLENMKQLEPITAGRFYIYGSHITDAPPKGLISLKVDATTAFGSGKHFTTKSCLIAFDEMLKHGFKPEKVLDMGCGTGILAVAAAKVTGKSALAVDIDEEAVKVAKITVEANKVENLVQVKIGNGYAADSPVRGKCYDLIFQNILAGPLVEMAADTYAHVSDGGAAILSGLLKNQAKWVVEAYVKAGFVLENQLDLEEWSTLIVRKA